jgi:hypothetical protein
MSDHHIHMQREPGEEDHTFGELTFNDFSCLTIEDEFRSEKVDGETRIPAGTMEVVLRQEGGMHKKCLDDPRFKDFHTGMLWLRPTDGNDEITMPSGAIFRWVYIHWGVTDDHTDGCVIVGESKIVYKGQPGVGHSTRAYKALYKLVVPYLIAGDRVFITIKDETVVQTKEEHLGKK